MSRHFDSLESTQARVRTLEAALVYAKEVIRTFNQSVCDPSEHSCGKHAVTEAPLSLADHGFCQDAKLLDAEKHIDAALGGGFDAMIEGYKK